MSPKTLFVSATLAASCVAMASCNAQPASTEPQIAAPTSASTPTSQSAPSPNLIRNGSFEGSLKYWIGASKEYWKGAAVPIEKGNAAFGEYCLKVPADILNSTPFALQPDKPVTVSFSARSAGEGSIYCVARGAARDYYQSTQGHFDFKDATAAGWKRFSHTFTPKAIDSNWILAFSGSGPFWIDGVVVTQSDRSASVYQPRRALEVTVEAPQLTQANYTKSGNILKMGEIVPLRIAVSNPSTVARKVTLRTQLLDYAGEKAFSAALDQPLAVAADKTVLVTVPMKLTGRGLMLARAQVLDGKTVIDKSDQPLTALAFPKAATQPDMRERIGASFRGPVSVSNGQQIGFRWCRWWWNADMGWSSVQPDSADKWNWKEQDEKIALLERHGMAVNYVLYSMPNWAKAEGSDVPKDMNWPGSDARWNDLTLVTSWDKYVTATVKRYADKNVVFEFVNEPDNGTHWDWDQYIAMAKRTYKVLKAANPKAIMLANATEPTPSGRIQQWFEKGGAQFTDVYTWHNYGSGPIGGASTILPIRRLLKSGGNAKAQIWFNEGGTFGNSSTDYAAPVMGAAPVDWAHFTVKSIAQLFAAGEDKHILFHTSYDSQGRSWWDWLYNGGAELWDENSQPMVGVPVWNVLADGLGLSTFVQTIKPEGAEMHVFQDERNERGLVVAWSNEGAKTFKLPLTNVIRRDVMGNDVALKAVGGTTAVVLPADDRPYYFFTSDKQSGAVLAEKLAPFDEG